MADKSIAGSKPISRLPLPEGMIRKGGQNGYSAMEGERPSPPAPFRSANIVTTFNAPFSFGTRVRVDGKTGIEGVVTGYLIYPQISEVKVSWFANGDSKSDWFAEWRVAEIVE